MLFEYFDTANLKVLHLAPPPPLRFFPFFFQYPVWVMGSNRISVFVFVLTVQSGLIPFRLFQDFRLSVFAFLDSTLKVLVFPCIFHLIDY